MKKYLLAIALMLGFAGIAAAQTHRQVRKHHRHQVRHHRHVVHHPRH
jgi:hypothetical protein